MVKLYNLGKLEDTQAADGDEGLVALAVRQDIATALATSDGDYIPLIVDSSGRLHVATTLQASDGTDIGDVDVASIALPTAVYNGQKTVSSAGTAEALASSQTLTVGVVIKALPDNTGDVYVGDSGVDSTNGYVLDASEEIFLEIDDLSTVYLDVDTNGEGVSYIGN